GIMTMSKKPAHKFTQDAVRKFQNSDEGKAHATDLNVTARNIASQYRRDTISPVMVSGVLRIVEFAVLALSGLGLFMGYVGIDDGTLWYYAATIIIASAATVMILELTNSYQIPKL